DAVPRPLRTIPAVPVPNAERSGKFTVPSLSVNGPVNVLPVGRKRVPSPDLVSPLVPLIGWVMLRMVSVPFGPRETWMTASAAPNASGAEMPNVGTTPVDVDDTSTPPLVTVIGPVELRKNPLLPTR